MEHPLGRLGPLENDSVRTEGEVGNVQGWKSRLGVPEHTQGLVEGVGKRQLRW